MKEQSTIQQVVRGMQKLSHPSDYWKTSPIHFPELEAAKRVSQRNNQSVFEHTMSVIDHLSEESAASLLSGLFHDLGKCVVPVGCDPSSSKFPGHPEASAIIAKETLMRWGCAPHVVDCVCRIVSTHMYDIMNGLQEKTIRKFIASVGPKNVEKWFVLRIADSRSYQSHQQYYCQYIQPFKLAVETYLDGQPGVEIVSFPEMDSGSSGGIQIKGGDAS